MAIQIEINPAKDYVVWAGDGTPSPTNPGIFSIHTGGRAFFAGSLRPEVIRTELRCSNYGPCRVETDSYPLPQNLTRRVTAYILYENSGFSLTQVTGTPQGVLSIGGALFNTNVPITGSVTNTPVSGGYQVSIKVEETLVFTDNRNVPNFKYSAGISSMTGPWPVMLGSSRGSQRLGIQVVTLN